MASSKEPTAWITVKGARVPIFEGQSKEDAVKEFRERIAKHNQSNQPITQGSKDKAKRDYSSAKKQAKRTERRQDEEGNRKANERLQEAQKKYNDTKEKTGIKSTSFGKKEDAIREKLTNNRARILKASPEERKNIVRENKELQSKLDKMQEQKNIAKNEDEKEKQIARNEAERRALTKHEKLVAQVKDNKRRQEQGIKTKYGAQDHTKLDQHPDIKKMAEDFNRDVWTREGGVRNGELYDKAKAWAKEHNYNEEKAVKAAMKARDDTYVKTHQRINEMANKKYGKNYSDLEDSQRKEIAKSAFEKQTEAGKYDKYKSGYRYENAKTVNVNGNEYKVWSDDTYRGTFAEDKNGNVLPIKQNGYLSNEVSQRKAIANTFKESSFRSKAVKETTKSQKYQGSLSKMNTNQLRDLAVELGADRKKLYGTSKNALISVISNLKK